MVAVPVRRDVVIDLREACVLDGFHDPSRIACRRGAPVSSVDEHRFTGGRHEQRRVSTLDVYDIDVERPARLRREQGGANHETEDSDDKSCAHAMSPY